MGRLGALFKGCVSEALRGLLLNLQRLVHLAGLLCAILCCIELQVSIGFTAEMLAYYTATSELKSSNSALFTGEVYLGPTGCWFKYENIDDLTGTQYYKDAPETCGLLCTECEKTVYIMVGCVLALLLGNLHGLRTAKQRCETERDTSGGRARGIFSSGLTGAAGAVGYYLYMTGCPDKIDGQWNTAAAASAGTGSYYSDTKLVSGSLLHLAACAALGSGVLVHWLVPAGVTDDNVRPANSSRS